MPRSWPVAIGIECYFDLENKAHITLISTTKFNDLNSCNYVPIAVGVAGVSCCKVLLANDKKTTEMRAVENKNFIFQNLVTN